MTFDIQDFKDRLDVLEGTTITSINEQISAINTSISDLKEMDESLDTYIKALETTATDLQIQIDDANAEIAKVEAELGEEISALEQSLLNKLNTAKETIETELLAITNTLAELKQADEALDKKISDLQAYVDTQLISTTNWAEATFSTLAQYEQTQTEISTIKASIEQINAGVSALETSLNGKIASDIQTAIDALRSELSTDYIARIGSAVNTMTQAYTTAISSAKDEITSAYTNAIATAIAASETNMQAWVNTVLTQGYYDIATIDGKLSALSAKLDETDTDLQNQITEQKIALETSREELTKAYKTAIKEAIEENNGVVSAAIASAVKEVEDKLQEQIDAISLKVDAMAGSLANLEEAFVNRIQSLKFIPEFSDRKVKFSGCSGAVLDFMVSPQRQADALAAAWNADRNIVKAYLRYTTDPSTRAVCEPMELAVASVTSNGKGDISVVVKESPETILSSDFWLGNQDAVVYLCVSDGSNDVISELIDVVGYIEEVEIVCVLGSGTKSVGIDNNMLFLTGTEYVDVNGVDYPVNGDGTNRFTVRVPMSDSYIVSYPADAVTLNSDGTYLVHSPNQFEGSAYGAYIGTVNHTESLVCNLNATQCIIKVTMSKTTDWERIVFSSNCGTAICGDAVVDSEYGVTSVSNGKDTVTIVRSNGEEQDVYFPLLPCSLNGVTVTIYKSDGTHIERTNSNNVILRRGYLLNLGNL